MKSRDFTKIAMVMGVVSGCLLNSSQASANEGNNSEESVENNNKGVFLAKQCGGGACKTNPGSSSYVADNCSYQQPSRGYDSQYNNQTRPTESCRSQQPSNNYQQQPTSDTNYQPANNNNQNQPTSSGCAHKQQPRPNSQTASGCAHKSRSSNGNVAEYATTATTATHAYQMSDEDFVKGISAESKAAYASLSSEGKALAQKYAVSGTDKNTAIKMAAQNPSEKRATVNQSNKY